MLAPALRSPCAEQCLSLSEPAAEPRRRKRRTVISHKIGEIAGRARIDDRLQYGQQRDFDRYRLAVQVLLGGESDPPAPDVLPT
jgi:hypothetical protein